MPVVEERVIIGRPPEEVFDYLAKVENLPVWESSIVEAEQLGDDPVAIGTRWRGTSKILGQRFQWAAEITEFDRPVRQSSRSVEGKLSFSVSNVLAPVEGGTQYTYRVDAEPGLGGVFGRLADPIVAKAQSRTVRASLDNLAALLAEDHQD
jgi:uncharacterized membrane protein